MLAGGLPPAGSRRRLPCSAWCRPGEPDRRLLEPVGRHGFNSLKAAALNSGRIGSLQPRAFYHPAENLAFTFDRRSGDGAVEGAFVWRRAQDGTELALTGAEAGIGVADGRRLAIRLRDGRYAAERPGTGPVTLAFDRLDLGDSLLLEEAGWARGWSQKELTLSELAAGLGRPHPRISQAEYRTEIYRRVRAAEHTLIPSWCCRSPSPPRRAERGGILLGGRFIRLPHASFRGQPGLAGSVSTEPQLGACPWRVALVLTSSVRPALPSRSDSRHCSSGRRRAGPAEPRGGRLRGLGGRTLPHTPGVGKWG